MIVDINYNPDRPRVGSDQPITGLHQSVTVEVGRGRVEDGGWRWSPAPNQTVLMQNLSVSKGSCCWTLRDQMSRISAQQHRQKARFHLHLYV